MQHITVDIINFIAGLRLEILSIPDKTPVDKSPAQKPTSNLVKRDFFINFYVGVEPTFPTVRAGVLTN